MRVHRLRLALATPLLSACFNPHIPEGRPCADDGSCPPRQECIDLVCRPLGYVPPRPDASILDSAMPDAEPALSDNADLAALSVSVPGLTPDQFDPSKYDLAISRLVRSLRVTAKPEDMAATLEIQGSPVTVGDTSPPFSVEPGTVVDITVTAPAGNKKSYAITVSPYVPVTHHDEHNADNADVEDFFGWDVAIDGDTLAVSASGEDSCEWGDKEDDACEKSGAVYVFRREGGAWRSEAYLKPSNIGEEDQFGISLALDGDTLVVGAFREDSASSGVNSRPDEMLEDSGAAYVFRRGDQGWSEEAYLKPASPETGQEFGWSVALAGDLIAVGARREDSGGMTDSGAVYLFRRQGQTWEPEAQLTADTPETDAFFGYSVAVAKDILAVGACGHGCPPEGRDIDPQTTGGTAYVFQRVGDWMQVADLASLVSPTPGPGDGFGFSVAVSESMAVVGVRYEDSDSKGINGDANNDSAQDSGAAYVFRREVNTWTREAYLKAHNTDVGDQFGASVAISDTLVAVGAPEEGDDNTQQGAVYLYRFDENWSQLGGHIKSSDSRGGDGFGWSTAFSDDALVVGAPYHDATGTVYRFH